MNSAIDIHSSGVDRNSGTGIVMADNALQAIIPPTITITTPTVASGSAIGFSVANGPAHTTDWVGLYPNAAADGAFIDWTYLNGQKTPPVTGQSSATLQFVAPATGGSYNIRFFASNSFTKLVTSDGITVLSQPTLTINDVSVTEGNSGTTTATFTVTLSPVNAAQTVTVGYGSVDGTATTANNDFVPATGTLTFNPSVATQVISVTVNGDTVAEPNETFFINLSNAMNAVIGDGQGAGTITNDDAPPPATVTMNTPTASPDGAIGFTVANGPANATDWVGLYAVGAPDMPAPSTWIYLNGMKTPPGTGLTGATLQFTAPAPPGTYEVRFFSSNSYVKLATSGNVVVQTQPTLTIGDVSVTEGNSGTTTAIFTVTLNPINAAQTVTVHYATADGTATLANNDYANTSGTLTFNPSVATQTISVTLNGDTAIEPNETFTLNLSGAINAIIGDNQGVGTITNDDAPPPPTVTMNTPTVSLGGAIGFTVADGPGNSTDWVALYAQGAPESPAPSSWSYLNGLKN